MLVKDLRKEVDKYNKKDLIDIIVELYKRVPKDKKEDYGIDNYIVNKNDKISKKEEIVDIETLSEDINQFLYYVDCDYYASPNKVVNKKERSKWRFKVKRYYKTLNEFDPATKDGIVATNLLIEIFKRLSIGTYYLKFSSWSTFGAIGVSQSLYYDTIVKRIFINSCLEEDIKQCVSLLSVSKDYDELSTDMYDILCFNLKNDKLREETITILKEKIMKLKEEKTKVKNNTDKYYVKEEINNMVYCIVNLYFTIGKMDSGITFFHKEYMEVSKEVSEYILLEIIEKYEDYETWIKEYEYQKLDYRDSLKAKYKQFVGEYND